MFNPFHPLLIPPQPCIPTFFGNYSNTPSADQSTSLSALTNNDLQIGVGTVDNTGSNVNFAAANMKHVNGLAVVNLNAKTVPQTYYYDGNTGKASSVRAASTTTATVWPSVNFSSSTKPYSTSNTSSLKRYLAIVKPNTATTISTTATSGCEAWSLSYNVSRNTFSSQSETSSRPGYYLGWVYSYTGAVQTFTAPENANYKLEVWGARGGFTIWAAAYEPGYGGYSVGQMSISRNQILYVCIGGIGTSNSGVSGGVGGYNGGGKGGNCNLSIYQGGSGGGGCSHIATSNYGELVNYNPDHLDDVLIVAGGGGGGLYSGSTLKGDGGGISGINAIGLSEHISYGGSSSNYYKIGKGKDGSNGTGSDCSSEGNGGGGGGYYGGLTYMPASSDENYNNTNGGGGSGFLSPKLSGASTIAGNTSFTSPSGGTETGHTGNGYAIITQVSY